MRRRTPAALALLAALALAPAARASDAPAARAVLVTCDRVDGVAVFEGRMETMAGAERMQMRFSLRTREAGATRWRRVRLPGAAAWRTSEPGHAGYVYTKRVEALVGPAAYRMVVRFRWLAPDGSVLRRARATSPACRQPDPRADVLVDAIEVRPALRPDRRRYAVTVRNRGHSVARASWVRLDLGDGGTPLAGEVGALAPGERETVVLPGRACAPGAALTATADATDVVDEHDEADDVLLSSCPA